ncbi:hypothetical protein LCGC14_1145820 [marine sediment metagenome]|uniref:Uncharacterized protein n=1 Tax=marine sediment metagenome TaxID=412755 RepID=A0A0F9M1Q5_9ZZZZ
MKILLLLLLLLFISCSSSAQVLNSPIESRPIHTTQFEWRWVWQENDYKEGISDFLQRDDIRVISITIHDRQTIILYQLRKQGY